MRKRPGNLKKRLDELREEKESEVELKLRLDSDLHHALNQQAAQQHLGLDAYLLNILRIQAGLIGVDE